MVERLKAALERAKRERMAGAAGALAPQLTPPAGDPAARRSGLWAQLPEISLDPALLKSERIISGDRGNEAHAVFDVLRTRIVKQCLPQGWRRIGVTSPTKGCGKSVVCMNLAISLSRHPEIATLLMDMDLRGPSIARMTRQAPRGDTVALLAGRQAPADHLVRVSDNLALGLSRPAQGDSAELFQSSAASVALAQMIASLAPNVVLYDLPPVLGGGDDVIAFQGHLDAIILVAAAGHTTSRHLTDTMAALGDSVKLIGVVLNKCVDWVQEAAYPYAGD